MVKFKISIVKEDEEILNILKSNLNFHFDKKSFENSVWFYDLGYIEINTLEELLKLKEEIHREFIISKINDCFISDGTCKNDSQEYQMLIYNGYIE